VIMGVVAYRGESRDLARLTFWANAVRRGSATRFTRKKSEIEMLIRVSRFPQEVRRAR